MTEDTRRITMTTQTDTAVDSVVMNLPYYHVSYRVHVAETDDQGLPIYEVRGKRAVYRTRRWSNDRLLLETLEGKPWSRCGSAFLTDHDGVLHLDEWFTNIETPTACHIVGIVHPVCPMYLASAKCSERNLLRLLHHWHAGVVWTAYRALLSRRSVEEMMAWDWSRTHADAQTMFANNVREWWASEIEIT